SGNPGAVQYSFFRARFGIPPSRRMVAGPKYQFPLWKSPIGYFQEQAGVASTPRLHNPSENRKSLLKFYI
ncbi:hypothetical protein, partial [Bradyrhizobium liaoningense]|uniref:hypothetical protein n=1 Tax=Bradyrhizobium liaoningense TaxID=43992 RepID=UPI001AEBEA79